MEFCSVIVVFYMICIVFTERYYKMDEIVDSKGGTINYPTVEIKGPGNDPQCNGTGWLWQDRYNKMPCWRCAGTGNVPELISPKERKPIINEAVEPETDSESDENTWGSEDESTQDASQGTETA